MVARADVFGQISLVSRDGPEQFLYARDSAISGDGQYVAFDGSLGGVTGVWRRDLQTGEVEQVAGGDAELPSISENGQYVSFTTTEGGQLATDTNGEVDTAHPEAANVYVRDMSLVPSAAGAFKLASAANGPGEVPLSYESETPSLYGSVAAGRSALSADGQKVAFVTTATSDLAGERTPPLQVAVRDLQTHETQLVSTELPEHEGEPPKPVQMEANLAGGGGELGAVFSNGTALPKFEPPASYAFAQAGHPVGASISANGSTVAWLGEDISAQVQMLPRETQPPSDAEPLWRRIEPEGPTLRVTGGSDPANPACQESAAKSTTESLANPCWGPFPSNGGLGLMQLVHEGDPIPQLSANGDTVAFLATAPPLALGEDFGKTGSESRNEDAYVSQMGSTSRVAALTPLTELSTGEEEDRTTNASITDVAISPEGTQVAFTTQRTQFPLPSLTVVNETPPEAGLAELYDVDLINHTLTRVTTGLEGAASEYPHQPGREGHDPYAEEGDGALSPSFTDDGDTLAFSSTAANLVHDDGNTPPLESPSGFDGSDVFVVPRVTFPSSAPEQQISSPPLVPAVVPAWQLSVTSRRQRNGTVTLYIDLPGEGTVRAAAEGAVGVKVTRYVRLAHSSKRVRLAHTTVAQRTIATKTSDARASGLVALTLTLAPRYSSLAARRGGFSAEVHIAFSSPAHPTLHDSVPVTFMRTPAPTKKAKSR
jgi:hypothetical protein